MKIRLKNWYFHQLIRYPSGINNYNMVVNQNLTDNILQWQGVVATKELATSPNAKVVVIGAGEDGLPIILGNQ